MSIDGRWVRREFIGRNRTVVEQPKLRSATDVSWLLFLREERPAQWCERRGRLDMLIRCRSVGNREVADASTIYLREFA